MKILVIFTGGTIGSSLDHATIVPNNATQSQLITSYQNLTSDTKTQFVCLSPFSILSENMQPADWTSLIELIKEQELSDYDGIIVTHGTDTLSYTANALALTLPELSLPLMLVSAHMPIENPQSNAINNFKAAIKCIKERLNGVYACYQNPSDDFVSIFHAVELTQSLQLSSHFQALTTIAARYKHDHLEIVSLPQNHALKRPVKIQPHFNETLLYIKPYPGLDYENFNLEGCSLILHDLYHSGTCDSNRLKPFIRQCKRQNILLIMAPLKRDQNYYETTQELINLGVHFLYDISIEHALVKTMLASKNFSNHEEILAFLQ